MSAGSPPGGRHGPPPQVPSIRRDSLRSFRILGCLPMALALTSCAGSPWGERLAGSFPPPVETAPAPAAPKASPSPAAARNPVPANPPQTAKANNAAKPSAPPASAASSPRKGGSPAVSAGGAAAGAGTGARVGAPDSPPPFPYRITLRLPQADPSAPAEAVTRALRTAGIPFEVETIERVSGGAQPPTVRPAPPPR
jgi:hypothetical protein